MRDLWDDAQIQGLDDLDLLVYRSRLLGEDRSVCNWKGGNTSTKRTEPDPNGKPVRALWVKGSGSDLKTITRSGFAGLRLDEVLPLFERRQMSDEEMVEHLRRCLTHPDAPRPSIETLLHAFIPFPHVDHTHPDAVIGFCNTPDGERLTRAAFGDAIAWIPYQRPGFALAREVGQAAANNPRLRAVFLAHHGLVTWGNTHREAYASTLAVIGEAAAFIEERRGDRPAFGGPRFASLPTSVRRQVAAQILPLVRGAVSQKKRLILHFDDSPPVLEFAGSVEGRELALVGSACPDHLVHTKHVPLFLEWEPAADPDAAVAAITTQLPEKIAAYAESYQAYARAHARPGDPEGDPYPRIILIPGIGLIATGPDKSGAANSAGLYHRAIEAIRGAWSLGGFTSLTAADAYGIEYWPLELYKLTLAPPEKEFSRRAALVTGAASGIGRSTALLLAQAGAHVVVADINAAGAQETAAAIEQSAGAGRALAVACDVTSEEQVREAFSQATLAFGGVDVVVSNAGLAMSAPIEETSLDDWHKLIAVLQTGYFLVSREAFRHWRRQGIGGSLIFVTSKNALVASRGAAAYNAVKAAELHLARSLAEEGGGIGVRVNCVAPDAVLEGSAIWNSRWRAERAQAYGIHSEELEAYYRSRTTLKVNVRPEDVAQAIAFFASERASRTTGCTLTVDGGVAAAYTR